MVHWRFLRIRLVDTSDFIYFSARRGVRVFVYRRDFAGGSPFSAALAGLLVNSRHIPFSFATSDLTGEGSKVATGLSYYER